MAKGKRNGKGMTVSEAGKMGGQKTAQTHGKEFYQSIGRKGGEARGKQREK